MGFDAAHPGSSDTSQVGETVRRKTAQVANDLPTAFHGIAGERQGGIGRARLVRRYGFPVPTDEALDAIQRSSPQGVVEIGAGLGYWAHLLAEWGVDVAAFDLEPPPSAANRWIRGIQPWHPVQRADHRIVERFGTRTLLMIWPPKDVVWPAEGVQRYHHVGGPCVLYVGEGPGGRTGDDVLHAHLGEVSTCAACTYDVPNAPCVCAVERAWQRVETVALPNWPGATDRLHVYRRRERPLRSRRTWRAALRGPLHYNL